MLSELHKHLQTENLLPTKSKLIVAVSGGVDSVSLLHLLHNLRDQYSWKIAVAHYNHGMRPDATKDAILVGELADKYNYPFYLGKYEEGNFSEAALRKARYAFLEQIRRDSGFDLIVTAHHNNDFLETALFNTIRGADREGMVALKKRRGVIVRPMLPFSKAEIIAFANLQNLPYREDYTNADLNYSRNFVRNVLISHGSVKFRNFHYNLNRRLHRINELNTKIYSGMERLATAMVTYEDKKAIEIERKQFNELSLDLQKNLFVFLVKRLVPSHKLTKVSIGKAVEFIRHSNSGSKLHLPGGLHLVNTYDTVVITSDGQEFSVSPDVHLHVLSDSKPFKNELFSLKLSPKQTNSVRLPLMKLYVRYRQPGDRIYPDGISGSKKLQDIFVDAKIPRHLRDRWPVVVNAKGEILTVPMVASDRRFKQSESGKYQYLTCEVV